MVLERKNVKDPPPTINHNSTNANPIPADIETSILPMYIFFGGHQEKTSLIVLVTQ